MSCGALESDLENCYQERTHNWNYCNNYHEFTVRCESEIAQYKVAFYFPFTVAPCTDDNVELYNGPSSRHGTVRVCVNGTWVKMCGYGDTVIDNNLASVVCTSIGFSPYGKTFI